MIDDIADIYADIAVYAALIYAATSADMTGLFGVLSKFSLSCSFSCTFELSEDAFYDSDVSISVVYFLVSLD